MAFNSSRFNLTPFNRLGIESGEIWLTVEGRERITATVGLAVIIYPSVVGNERVTASSYGMPTRFAAGSGSETVSTESITALQYLWCSGIWTEQVDSDTVISANSMMRTNAAEIISGSAGLGRFCYLTSEVSEIVGSSALLGQNIYAESEVFELVSSTSSVNTFEEKTCSLNLTLRPGQILVINSENYSVTLDGQNAIYVQSGDWIDELDRNTMQLAISASSGAANLSASIIYTERYL